MSTQIILIILMIIICLVLIADMNATSTLEEEVKSLNTNITTKFGATERRIISLERKTKTRTEESRMTDEKMNAINEWLNNLDTETLTVADKLEIQYAAVEHIARLETLYDKYHTKDVRYR